MKITPEWLASTFHDTYETLAPMYGYETREDTKEFDAKSKNGRLMIKTCELVIAQLEGELKDYDYNPK